MSGIDFGLGGIMDMFTTRDEQTLARQEQEKLELQRIQLANDTKRELAQSSMNVTQELVDSLVPATQTLEAVEKAKLEQQQLLASGNPMDFLTAVGQTVSNPALYTKEGRSKTVAEVSQSMSVQAQLAGIKQSALSDIDKFVDADLAAKSGKLATAKLAESQTNELLTQELLRTQTLAQQAANNLNLQQAQLANMTTEQTRALSSKAAGKPIDVGGVMISPGTLEERLTALDNRELAQMNVELARQSKNLALEQKNKRKVLETMSLEELRPLRLNGSPQFDLNDIADVYDKKQAAANDMAKESLDRLRFTDFGAGVIQPAVQDALRMEPNIPKNSQLAGAFESYKRVVIATNTAAAQEQQLTGQTSLQTMQAGDAALRAAKEVLDKQIEAEATKRGKGDKNLTDMYRERFRGNPVPREAVEGALTTRLEKNMPLDDVVPAEVGTKIRDSFNQIYQQKLASPEARAGFTDKTQLKQEAMREAITKGINETIQKRTMDVLRGQVSEVGNPLRGVMSEEEFISNIAIADRTGAARLQNRLGLDDNELQMFLSGKPVPGKTTPQDAIDLEREQNLALLAMLDAKEPGLSKRYIDWWGKDAAGFVGKRQAMRQQQEGNSSIKEAAVSVYADETERQQFANYSQTLFMSNDSYQDFIAKRYTEMLSFDLRPDHRQAALLQFDENLSDGDRQQFMKGFVLPILQSVDQSKVSYEQANALVEQAIAAGPNPDMDPTTAKVLKKVMANRSAKVEQMESVMTKPFWRMNPDEPRIGFQPDAWLRRSVSQRSYQWYTDLQTNQLFGGSANWRSQ